MLKARIIPTLLWKNLGLVKGVAFDSWRRVGTVLPAVKVYNTREVDELILLDITATLEGRPPDLESLNEISAECFVPFTYGGGLRSIEDIRNVLTAGADKVCVNSVLYEDENFLKQASDRFGSQCLVASIDAKQMPDGRHICFSHSGTRQTLQEAAAWAARLEKLGAGEILVTSIDRDGSMQGYDLALIKKVADSVSIPVIASGGAGNYEDLFSVFSQTRAAAAAAASIFHFTEQTPREGKLYLKEKGVPVRL